MRALIFAPLSALLLFATPDVAQAGIELHLEGPDNIIANLMEGSWVPDTDAMGDEEPWIEELRFELDPTAIPQAVMDALSERVGPEVLPVYAIGNMTIVQGAETHHFPFMLTVLHGNPHVVFFQERDGDPFGDTESFNLMAWRTHDDELAGPDDRLFLGGDFNNSAMQPLRRK
jgi:hypothetical protein